MKSPTPTPFRPRSWRALLLVAALSVGLLSVIFPPRGLPPLAYVCLVPWLVMVAATVQAPRVYFMSYLIGLAMFLINLRWLRLVTVEGYIALSIYLAVYFPLAACPLRHAVRHWRLPLSLAAPIVWVGAEYVRAWLMSGFPWLFLAHTQYRFLSLIQISDLVGAYGVSFVVVSVNGMFADLALAYRRVPLRAWLATTWKSPVIASLIVTAALAYGRYQLGRDTIAPGPRVAVLQRDYPLYVEDNDDLPSEEDKAVAYFKLLPNLERQNVDIYLFPETPWVMFLNPEFREQDLANPDLSPGERYRTKNSRAYFEAFQQLAQEQRATVVVGAIYHAETPLDLRASARQHNSAYVFTPDGNEPQRYDKIHCVPFGEIVPFRYGQFRFFYLWLNERMPFGQGGYEYSLTPGTEFKVFEMSSRSRSERSYRFGTMICYEDVMPYVAREFTRAAEGGKNVDFLLNISNDGWFQHSDELTQHLVGCAFRAVENRVGIARAVNTGISGFIDSDGRIHDLVTANGVSQGPGIEGAAVANIGVDSRQSLYSRTGDVFAQICLLLWGLFYLDYLRVRSTGRRSQELQTG